MVLSEPPEPPPGPAATANWAVSALRSLTLQNVLTLALLAVIAAPSYFSWKFLTDDAFRHEFTSSARIIKVAVPCDVILGNLGRKEERHTIFVTYRVVDRKGYIVGIQEDGTVSDAEISELCKEVQAESALLVEARDIKAELAREHERAQAYPGASHKAP